MYFPHITNVNLLGIYKVAFLCFDGVLFWTGSKLGFTLRSVLPIILTQNNRYGRSINTKVFIHERGAMLLEGTSRETSTKVTANASHLIFLD